MIPKIIHCCWFSGEEKTPLAKKCRDSWTKFAPDREVHEWNSLPEDAPPFVREALKRRKWAFAADWMRFWVLEKEGGVYFDFDVELVKGLDGLPSGEWCGGERLSSGRIIFDPGCGISLEKGSLIAKKMLKYYETAEYGEETVGSILERVRGDVPLELLAPEVFSPIASDGTLCLTEATRGIHHYAMSWCGPKKKLLRWLSWHGFEFLVKFLVFLKHKILK